ncbi:DeoR/GlpR family DNA-binding transcription regulator [Taklimakanibacter lacteus]|uniref:DeoR/GlpR family DNA-binding transcription regulator n=1 Tax=Taklimakanibacter lacteus TaxID=2268456 RepID=UPI000E66556B
MSNASTRRNAIADYIMQHGQVRIDDLVTHFGVSRMTIHRHIEELAHQGMIRKLRGAVTVQPSGLYESAFRYRETVGKKEKLALARAALAYVEPGQAVMLDDSSTAAALAPLLVDVKPLTILTNSVFSASHFTEADEIDLINLGGQFHRSYNAYIGMLCEKAIASVRANVLFCSASAVMGTSAFVQDAQVVKVKQAMMLASSQRILLVDHTKFNKVALHLMADLTVFDKVLVSEGLPADELRRLEEAGVKLHVVRTSGKS